MFENEDLSPFIYPEKAVRGGGAEGGDLWRKSERDPDLP